MIVKIREKIEEKNAIAHEKGSKEMNCEEGSSDLESQKILAQIKTSLATKVPKSSARRTMQLSFFDSEGTVVVEFPSSLSSPSAPNLFVLPKSSTVEKMSMGYPCDIHLSCELDGGSEAFMIFEGCSLAVWNAFRVTFLDKTFSFLKITKRYQYLPNVFYKEIDVVNEKPSFLDKAMLERASPMSLRSRTRAKIGKRNQEMSFDDMITPGREAFIPKAALESSSSEFNEDFIVEGSGKKCAFCFVRNSPIWRQGPDGHGTLCHSCGIKWRQGRIAANAEFKKKKSASVSISSLPEYSKIKKKKYSSDAESDVDVKDSDDSDLEVKEVHAIFSIPKMQKESKEEPVIEAPLKKRKMLL